MSNILKSEEEMMFDVEQEQMQQQDTEPELQQQKVFRKYCPFRPEGSKCSSDYCALAIDTGQVGVCAFTMIAVYLSVLAQTPYMGE